VARASLSIKYESWRKTQPQLFSSFLNDSSGQPNQEMLEILDPKKIPCPTQLFCRQGERIKKSFKSKPILLSPGTQLHVQFGVSHERINA
jgi:hypothetical protein